MPIQDSTIIDAINAIFRRSASIGLPYEDIAEVIQDYFKFTPEQWGSFLYIYEENLK